MPADLEFHLRKIGFENNGPVIPSVPRFRPDLLVQGIGVPGFYRTWIPRSPLTFSLSGSIHGTRLGI